MAKILHAIMKFFLRYQIICRLVVILCHYDKKAITVYLTSDTLGYISLRINTGTTAVKDGPAARVAL